MLLLLLLTHLSRVHSVRPQRRQPTRLPCPWDSPGKNTGVGCISFSNAWKWKVKVKSLSHVWLLATPWTAACQAPPFMGFSRQEYWSGVPLPSPTANAGDVKDVGSISRLRRSPRGGNGNPLQYSWLENPMDEPGGLQAIESKRVGHDWRDLAAHDCKSWEISLGQS